MKMTRTNIASLALAILFMLAVAGSCRKKPAPDPTPQDSTTTLTPDTIRTPLYFPQPIIPADNQPVKEIAQLGRMLYYDTRLSNDGRSCAGCHIQSIGFTTHSMLNGTVVLPHVNMAWYNTFMWDGSKTGTLEDVMTFEVQEFFATDLNRINTDPIYSTLFRKYFKTNTITYKHLAYALAQFARTMVSGNSRYDLSLRGIVTLTPDERAGKELFFTERGDCFHCHTNPVMTDNAMHNTGLDSIYTKDADKGYYNVTHNTNDLGKFRTPNLRNVALRTRFMHDGRFTTLEEVINFYDHGMRKVSNLDPIMLLPAKEKGLQLEEWEKQQLIAFLKTLTDTTFTTNPAFSNPN
ncbi:MAG: hypothetical protein JNM41_05775 [Flavipsychrobacter sp.]|nr:hypothetical protein [Flavipsychrobacter sp.]